MASHSCKGDQFQRWMPDVKGRFTTPLSADFMIRTFEVMAYNKVDHVNTVSFW